MMPDMDGMELHMPFLEDIASKSSFILEIGIFWGTGSARAFTRGLKKSDKLNKLYISVDWDPAVPLEKPDLDYWHMVYGWSTKNTTLEQVKGICGNRKADIIFIDTTHNYETLSLELRVWSNLADQNTLWIFHDTYMYGQYNHMTDAIKDFCKNFSEWEFIDYTKESHGLGMMIHKQGSAIHGYE